MILASKDIILERDVSGMDIAKITLKSTSGFGPYDAAYKDKLTLTDSSIIYEYIPMYQSETNTYKKWSYKTTNPAFKDIFRQIAKNTPEFFQLDVRLQILDAGFIDIIATYSNKCKDTTRYYYSYNLFNDYFKLIRKLVPRTEDTPAVLRTNDDFSDE